MEREEAARLARKFALVDASFGFLARHRAVLSVKNVLRMAASLGVASNECVSREELHRMAAVAPSLMRIEACTDHEARLKGEKTPHGSELSLHVDDVYRAAPTSEEEREVVAFPLVPQASRRASEKRKKLFAEAIAAAENTMGDSRDSGESRTKGASVSLAATRSSAAGNLGDQQQEQQEQQEQFSVSARLAADQPAAAPAREASSLYEAEAEGGSPVIDMLRQLELYNGQIVHVERLPARTARFRDLSELSALDERVVRAVKAGGAQQLYSHQFEAIQALLSGKNVVLSTSTASGKSLAYNAPMANMLLGDEAATFMYLFPTKALAQDQLKALRGFVGAAGLPLKLCATFDGDTEMKARTLLIRETSVFLTNPDMLHLSILPQHSRWKRVLANLRMIVVDEAHMYRGVFGSHVACVFRRLFRLCALHGSNPQVVCCSATIGNPAEHFRLLFPTLPPAEAAASLSSVRDDETGAREAAATGVSPAVSSGPAASPPNFHFFRAREVLVITEDGAPRGEKFFCVWNSKAASSSSSSAVRGGGADSKQGHTGSKGHGSKKRKREHRTGALASESGLDPAGGCQRDDDKTDSIVPTAAVGEDQPVARTTSAIFHGARIFARLMEAEVHTLLFCRGRKVAEHMLMTVHSILRDGPSGPSPTPLPASTAAQRERVLRRISTYRGGYTVDDRRAIERRLFSGDLLGVIATNALELGIDVGALDCTVHLGLPASIASLWQQAGRAGRHRSLQASTAVVVCFDSPLDQHFSRHARELFRLPPEAVGLNPNNVQVLSQHLVCAAREAPLYSPRSGMSYVDAFVFGSLSSRDADRETAQQPISSDMCALLRPLLSERKLMRWPEPGGESYRIHALAPKAGSVSLRSINEAAYTVVTDDDAHEVLDSVPGERVFFQVYPTAVYLHQAREYLITRIDSDEKLVFAKPCHKPLTYFTTCRDYTDLVPVQIQWQRPLAMRDPPLVVGLGVVSATTRVFGSRLLEKRTLRVIGTNEFSLPLMQSFGRAVWLELPREARERVEVGGGDWIGALHGVGHLCVAVVRFFVLCDATDIGTEHPNPFEARVKPSRVTLYEQREGGSGLVDEILKVLPQVVDKAWAIAAECACADGCPSCIQSAACSEFNHVLDKRGTLQVLEFLHDAFATGCFESTCLAPAVSAQPK